MLIASLIRYVLSEELAGGGKMLRDEHKPAAKQLFAPVFLEVVDALRELVELPLDSETWSPDQQEDFKRFRYAVGDAIFDSCKVAGSVHVIDRLYARLQATLPAFQADPNAHWRVVEGCIYCLRQSISSNDPTFFSAGSVADVLRLLPSLPPVGTLQSTAIRTVGTYAAWLHRNPSLLPPLLTFVSNGLTSQATAAAAAQALKHMCESCAENLAEQATMSQLISVYQGTLPLELPTADRVDIITALSSCVSQMPVAHMLGAMQLIAQPLVSQLRVLLQSDSAQSQDLAVLLEQLCALLRGVHPQSGQGHPLAESELDAVGGHPSVQLLQGVWDVLDAIFVRHATSSNAMEKLCRCYKHTARTAGDSFRLLVPPLIRQMTTWFERQPHSCFLYMVNVCLSAFGHGRRSNELLALFAEAFRRMTIACFQLLWGPSGNWAGLVDNPDVVDDLFELCGKVLRYQPSMLLETDQLSNTFACACAALHLHHREAGRSALRFFENLVDLLVRPDRGTEPLSDNALGALRQLLGSNGGQLVKALVEAIAGRLPPQRIRLVAPLMRQLILVDPTMVRPWARAPALACTRSPRRLARGLEPRPLHAHAHHGAPLFPTGAPVGAGGGERSAGGDACRRRRLRRGRLLGRGAAGGRGDCIDGWSEATGRRACARRGHTYLCRRLGGVWRGMPAQAIRRVSGLGGGPRPRDCRRPATRSVKPRAHTAAPARREAREIMAAAAERTTRGESRTEGLASSYPFILERISSDVTEADSGIFVLSRGRGTGTY